MGARGIIITRSSEPAMLLGLSRTQIAWLCCYKENISIFWDPGHIVLCMHQISGLYSTVGSIKIYSSCFCCQYNSQIYCQVFLMFMTTYLNFDDLQQYFELTPFAFDKHRSFDARIIVSQPSPRKLAWSKGEKKR